MLTYKNREIPETFAEIVDPKHTALIVHEMLNDFLNPNGEFARTIPDNPLVKCMPDQVGPLVNLVNEARAAGVKSYTLAGRTTPTTAPVRTPRSGSPTIRSWTGPTSCSGA